MVRLVTQFKGKSKRTGMRREVRKSPQDAPGLAKS